MTNIIDKYYEEFVYLDNLRESGVTNMFGASRYVEGAFGHSDGESRKILMHWMETFNERHGKKEGS